MRWENPYFIAIDVPAGGRCKVCRPFAHFVHDVCALCADYLHKAR